MFGWGNEFYQLFSKKRQFLHVIETHIKTFISQLKGKKLTISVENNRKIATEPDLALHVRKENNLNDRLSTQKESTVFVFTPGPRIMQFLGLGKSCIIQTLY